MIAQCNLIYMIILSNGITHLTSGMRACVRLSNTTVLHFNSPAEPGCCIFRGRTNIWMNLLI
jgi:hypothetical protein